ncbi:toxin-antitoxin system YwqK family antitoxin [Geofilum rhodophaeum]|uniref:toxin-antitoxin system YwqK family antitoxin n=1 Tax=Geofilum rhodophaeum TaxID=1965019 RepID=UPI000B521E74|nr:toxin-antitoxin system YwqK family antitoxin [Geofilum rhodophaeum]
MHKFNKVLIGSLVLLFINVSCSKTKKEYFDDGSLKYLYHIKDDIPHGEFKSFFASGELESIGILRNGVKVGEWIWYHESGNVQNRSFYKEGKLNGDYIDFYPNGSKKLAGFMVNNLRDGEFREYYNNGIAKSIQFYKADKQNGYYKSFYIDGQLKMEAFMKNDKTIYYEKYNEKGGLIDTYNKVTIKKEASFNSDTIKFEIKIFGDLKEYESCNIYVYEQDMRDRGDFRSLLVSTKLNKVFVELENPAGEEYRKEVMNFTKLDLNNNMVCYTVNNSREFKYHGELVLSYRKNRDIIDVSYPFVLEH